MRNLIISTVSIITLSTIALADNNVDNCCPPGMVWWDEVVLQGEKPADADLITHDAMLMKRHNINTVVIPKYPASHICRGIFTAFGIKVQDEGEGNTPSLANGLPRWASAPLRVVADRTNRETGELEQRFVMSGTVGGLVDWRRKPNAALSEFTRRAQPFSISREGDGFKLLNRSDRLYTDDYDGFWTLVENGVEVASGRVTFPRISPRSCSGIVPVGFAELLPTLDPSKEYFIDFAITSNKDEPWAKAGYVVSRDQIPVEVASKQEEEQKIDETPVAAEPPPEMYVEEEDNEVRVEMAYNSAIFEQRTGTVRSLVMRGLTVFDNPHPAIPAGPRVINAATGKPFAPKTIKAEGNTVTVTTVNTSRTDGIEEIYESVWTFATNGTVTVSNKIKFEGENKDGVSTNHAKLSVAMRLPPWLARMRYYGLGPEMSCGDYERDGKTSFVGIHTTTVRDETKEKCRDMIEAESTHSGVRWVEFFDKSGRGARFSFSSPTAIMATNYSTDEMKFLHRSIWMPDSADCYCPTIAPRDEVMVSFNPPQCDSVEWSFTITPLRR